MMSLVMIGAGFVLAIVAILILRELRRNPYELPSTAGFVAEDEPGVTKVGVAPVPIRLDPQNDEDTAAKEASLTVYESDSQVGIDEPTGPVELILLSAVGQSDTGRRRRRNEDCYLELPEHGVYVVADGMGGYVGGDVASRLAIDTIAKAFKSNTFVGQPNSVRPRRGNELVWAIEAANAAIFEVAQKNRDYQGMGTTTLGARFLPKKQRVFIGHVGDSRCYRFRGGTLIRLTNDHTLAASGVTGPYAEHLSRALGIKPRVTVDLIVDTPQHDDLYLLCTDGLTKMVPDDGLQRVISAGRDHDSIVKTLVGMANDRGGRDNITVIVVAVKELRLPGAGPSRPNAGTA
jgi:serine/threonine protein phosphatase PrpC